MDYAHQHSYSGAYLLCCDHLKWSFFVRPKPRPMYFRLRGDVPIQRRPPLARLFHPGSRRLGDILLVRRV